MLKQPDTPMYDYLYSVLSPVCDERAAVELKAEGELPDRFCVFYRVDNAPAGHFSGRSSRERARYSVVYYDRDKAGVEITENTIKAAMADAGFLFIASARDTYFKDTGHWSRTYDFRYIEEV